MRSGHVRKTVDGSTADAVVGLVYEILFSPATGDASLAASVAAGLRRLIRACVESALNLSP